MYKFTEMVSDRPSKRRTADVILIGIIDVEVEIAFPMPYTASDTHCRLSRRYKCHLNRWHIWKLPATELPWQQQGYIDRLIHVVQYRYRALHVAVAVSIPAVSDLAADGLTDI